MRVTRLAVMLALGLSPLASNAEDAVRWRCAYDPAPAPRIACRLVRAPGMDAAAPFPETAGRQLPMLTRIRTVPETLVDERIVIPLWGPPVDMRFVARLATEVMCGRRPDCGVDFSSDPIDE
ncbi:MAG TPA: hypothetical protein VI319_04890 [Burkholderiales bacterium]